MIAKNILIAAEIFPPEIGGPATYTVELANALHQRGFKVRVLCYGQPDKVVLEKGIKINWVSHKWPLPIKYFLYFKKLFCLSFAYQTIYAMGPVASGLPAMLVKKITGKKMIVKVVGDYAWEQAMSNNYTKLMLNEFQQKKFSGKIGLLQKIERAVCKAADLVVVPSEYLKNIVAGWGVEEEKIKVIYNAFSSNYSGPDLKNGQKVEKKKELIVSIGRLVKWKGFKTLIEIIPELLKINPDFKLIIGGSGPEEKDLKTMIQKANLNKSVEIKKMDKREVIMSFQQASLFVLNTAYEGLSHTILEALAIGIPVITTNVGGNPELIQDGKNGILIAYDNKEQIKTAILKLYNNPELGINFVANSRELLEKFTFEKMINETEKILKTV